METLNCPTCSYFENSQKEFLISTTDDEQLMFQIIIPFFSFPKIFPITFSFAGSTNGNPQQDRRFKMILWSIIGGTRGGVNRAKILNIISKTPMNANKIATILNLDHKTVLHHVKILAKNNLIVKAEKNYAAEFELTKIMKDNQNVLEEIIQKIAK